MAIYEKSTNNLLEEYIKQNLGPGITIDRDKIVTWFSQNYPKIKSNTVGCHIIKFTTNHHTRVHYKAGPQHDRLFQLPNKSLRLYNPETDPKPIYSIDDAIGPITDDEPLEDSTEFAYESHLRDYLKSNLHKIESGLHLYTDEEDENITGVEFDAGGRRIDILALDKDNNFVVIELKVSKGHEQTIGQLLRYKGWVRKNLSNGQKVRGIVIAKVISDDLKLAANEIVDVDLFEYDLKIDVRKIDYRH